MCIRDRRLGDYREVVSRHDTDLPIRISVTLDGDAEELQYSLEASMGGVVESFAVDGEEGWKWDSRTDGAVEASGRLFFPIAAGGYGGGVFTSPDPAKTMQEQKRTMGWFENMLYLSSNRGFTKYNYPLLAGKPTVEDISNRTGDSSALEEWLSNLIIYRINEAKRYPAMEAQLDRMTDRLSSLGVEKMCIRDRAEMCDMDAVRAFREHALNPEHPAMRGSHENGDVFFQHREACNGIYDALPAVVEDYMHQVNAKLGTNYELFNYYGAPDADRVIVAMGSFCDVVEEVVDYLNAHGEKVGLVKVRLYRPFVSEKFMAALPATCKKIAVMDRTKEPGALGEPLYMDVVNALAHEGRGDLTVVGLSLIHI